MPGTMGDPFRVVMLLPGRGQHAVRGGLPGGARQPAGLHRLLPRRHPRPHPLPPLPRARRCIHPDFIDAIDFYPGTPPPQYGRLMGGAIEGRLSRPRDDRVHGSAYADLINAGLFVEYPFQSTGTNVSMAGRYSYTPWLIALAANALQIRRLRRADATTSWCWTSGTTRRGWSRTVGAGTAAPVRLRLLGHLRHGGAGRARHHRAPDRALPPAWTCGTASRWAPASWRRGSRGPGPAWPIVSQSQTTAAAKFNIDQRDAGARAGLRGASSPRGCRLRGGADMDHQRAEVTLASTRGPASTAASSTR